VRTGAAGRSVGGKAQVGIIEKQTAAGRPHVVRPSVALVRAHVQVPAAEGMYVGRWYGREIVGRW